MAVYNKFNAFVENVNEAVHNFSSDATCTPTIFATAHANAPVATNSILGDITQIAYTNLSTRVLAVASSAQASGTYRLIITDLVLTASGAVATFRELGIYNDDPTSPADPLICWFDYGADVTLANGETFTLDFDGTNGLYSMV